MQSTLLQHVNGLTQGAQQNALQVLGQGQQAVGGALTELGAQRDQVQSALLDHVNTLTGGAQSGLQSLATAVQPTIQTLGGGQPSISGGAPVDTSAAAAPPDRSMSLQDYARAAAQRAGIDPQIFVAQIQQESGFDPTAKSPAGALGVAQFMPTTAQGVGVDPTDPYASLDAAARLDAQNLKKYNGDYSKVLAAYNAGGGAVDQYGGVPPFAETQNYVKTILSSAQQRSTRPASDLGYQDVSQFGDSQLTSAEAYAACGPAAAVRFAERFGRNPTLREATDLAKDVGWTSQGGMAGIASEQKLMTNLGIDTKIVGRDWSAYAKEAATGNPVTISTPGHYFYADGYNAESGAFHVGRSGLDLKGGAEWMTPAQMENLMGTAQGALFSNNPNVPAKGSVTASDEPINLGGRPQARAPLVMGGMQDASGNVVADQGPTPIQTAQDVLGGAAEAVTTRVGQVASDLGSAAQGVLGAAQDINRIQPGTEAVRAITPALGGAAQQVGQTAQDINRLQPGAAAVQAATPVLGGVASDIGAGARGVVTDLGGAVSNAYGLNRTPQERQAADEQYQRDVQAAAEAMNRRGNEPITVGDVASNAWNQIIGANPPMGISLQQYQDAQNVKNQWLEQNNPARDVLVLGGLTTSIAQQLTDPLMIATFGPSMGLGRAAGAATAERVGGVLTGRLAPRAVEFASTVADKLASGAIIGGVQNALLEAEKPDATPESVFTALWQGAGFGAAADVGSAAAAPVVRRIGQTLIDRAAELRPRVAEFLGSEAGGVRLPAQQDVLHGQAVPRPGYEPGTPEHTTETFLQDQARQQGTPRPTISGADVASLPGMAGSRSRGLQEVRDATEAGLPAARWYQQIVQQVRQDTGQDINPREAAVLMGATGGNAGVQPNYHAMLSVFDAMRQAKPDLVGLENLDLPQVKATTAFKDVQALVRADSAYIDDDMLAKVMRGYRTGEVPVPSGAKLSSYTQDFLHALSESYAPYSTQDVHQGRLFGARPDVQGGKPLPDVSQNDQAYRTMHALTNWVAREMNLPPDQAQAAGWTTFRTLWTDPIIGPELRNDRIGLSDAIKQGQQAGLLNPQTLATGGLDEVRGPRMGPPTSWSNKINDVRDRIRQNGSYNAPPPASATALGDIALYHPSIQSALQKRTILDPSGFEYGTVSGPKTGIRRPVGAEPATALRDLALADQPVIRVPGELQVDPSTGKIPWLALEHDVQQTAGHAYVTVAGVGDDAAHLIGQRLGADRFNHADPTAKSAGGIAVDLGSRADQARLSDALRAQGLPVLRETAGMGVRVPLMEGKAVALVRQVQQILNAEGISGTLTDYRGATHAVESGGPGARGAGRAGSQAGAAGPLGLQAGDGVRRQQLAQAVFRDAAPAAEAGAAAATGGGLRGARQRAESTLGLHLNVGGAVAGGVAGNVATPENATPEERLRNIALGAGAGLAAGRLVPRALEGGFRAPRMADVAELARSERGEVPIVPGEQLPPERPGPVGREPAGAPPQSLSEVHSNPHLLREAAAGETPMTDEQLAAHYDQLDQRYQQNQDRLASIDEQLRNPNAKPERPPWAAGWTNDELAQVASSHGASPYEPLWWEKVGLNTGSDEVKRLAEGGFRTPNAGREPTPTELRAERNTLAAEQRDIQAAADQLGNAAPGQRFTTRTQTPADLPFAGGEEEAPHGPYATEQASSGPGSLAEDIVTQNGRKSYADPLTGDGLREAPGEVVGTRGGVTGRGISDVEAARVGEPSSETVARMPNLDAMLKGDMPEVRAQIQRAAEDNPELFDAYRQGRISHDSLVTDLATKVGMTREQWLKTPVGKGFSTEEMVALQAAAIDAQARSEQMAKDIAARGGVDALSPEQVAYGLNELVNNTRLLAVARGGRTTAGRTLNALKNRLDATLARGITASNDRIAATRLASQARAAVKRATQQLEQAKELDAEKQAVVKRLRRGDVTPVPSTEEEQIAARERGYENIPPERRGPVGPGEQVGMPGTPPPRVKVSNSIIDQIAEAYDQLDRYQAMSLHEKADDYNALKAQRDAAAARRKAAVREPPQELLSALQAELKAERDNFAKRKDTWETMAFWDSKANENAVAKRNAFRGGLYIEQYRKAADLAAKSAEADAKRAWNLESKRQSLQTQKATTLLEAVGGARPSRELLAAYVEAVNSNDPLAAGKFVKGLMTPGWWARAQTLRIAGLLSSTITHMANMVGNVTQVPLEVATHAAVVPIDWARARATGGRRVAYMAELGPMLEAYGPGFLASMPDAVKILQTGITPADAVKLENIRPGFASGSGKVDAALEGPLRALQAEDQLFRGGAFAMQAARVATRYAYREGFRGEQLAGRRANIIKNLEDYPDLYKEAHDAMLRMVFQEHRDWIPAPRGAARGVVSQPLPFIKTPANITAQGMGLSPFGVAGSIEAVRARGALEATGKATTAQLDRATLLAEQRIARTAIGTAIVGLGIGLGAGTFTGGKSMLTGAYDPNEASTYPQGWREWSMVAEDPVSGNTYYIPMQNFGAAGAPLAMAAILTDAAKRGHSLLDKDEVARAATSIGQYVLDNTFLQGLSDTVNVLHDPSRYANKFLESLVSSYGPYSAMGRQIQRAYGVASRNPHDGLMGLVEAMEANYPGVSGNVPESLTAIGEPRTQGISGAAAFALPLRADILRDEPTLQALRANDVRIPPPAKSVNVGNGWAIDLTPEEQDQVQRARGEQIRQQVAAVMDSTLYKNGDISVKNQLLSKAISNASQNSDVLFVRSLGDADIKQRAVRKTVPTPYTVAGEPAA
ncbi:MAG TPA: lytic transglycosylase domain-containing protein [Gemmatimonadales bacterium]|nr:lytic transglycosylase domain-containing protein [Gemmatimonadales bacterium]